MHAHAARAFATKQGGIFCERVVIIGSVFGIYSVPVYWLESVI